MVRLKQVLAFVLTWGILLVTSPVGSEAWASVAVHPPVFAMQEAAQANLSASQIDELVSPIALYPDALVAQILAGSTYPDQIVTANSWLQANSKLNDAQRNEQVNAQSWDPSVKALTQFPSVLSNMAQNLSWTSALGDAFYNQQADVMASVQRLRKQAKAAGNLKSTSQQTVTTQTQEGQQVIVIQPANPQVVYVPTYNPTVVYGTPYYPPGYSTAALVTTGLISFGVGMAIGASMNNSCCGWGYYGGGWGCNWRGGNVMYQNNVYVSRSNTFYGGNRYHNNSYYKNNNRPVPNNNNGRYNANNRPNNKQAWSGNNNSGRGNGNKVNVNGDVNIGSNNKNRPGNNNNRPGNNNNGNNRPGN